MGKELAGVAGILVEVEEPSGLAFEGERGETDSFASSSLLQAFISKFANCEVYRFALAC
jgi:hypothetical protein